MLRPDELKAGRTCRAKLTAGNPREPNRKVDEVAAILHLETP